MAAMSGAWLCKKVRHPWLGGARRLTMYLATLDCATSNPSLSSSPCAARPKADFRRSSAGSMRAAPCRSAVALPGRATSNASSCESRPCANARASRVRMIVRTCWIDGNQRLDQEPAIMVREPDATIQPTPHDNQLMSKHRVLGFKPQLRLEWRGQDGQNETEQPDHSASSGDSIMASTRIRFSVHTGTRPAHLGLFNKMLSLLADQTIPDPPQQATPGYVTQPGPDRDRLEAGVDRAIAACGGHARGGGEGADRGERISESEVCELPAPKFLRGVSRRLRSVANRRAAYLTSTDRPCRRHSDFPGWPRSDDRSHRYSGPARSRTFCGVG
jgi:hypothetical protein